MTIVNKYKNNNHKNYLNILMKADLLRMNLCLVLGIGLNPELPRKFITLQPGRTGSQLGCLEWQDPQESLPPWPGLPTRLVPREAQPRLGAFIPAVSSGVSW